MIHLIIFQSQARLEMIMIDQKMVLKQQEKRKYTTYNHNIANKDDTSSNISKSARLEMKMIDQKMILKQQEKRKIYNS